MLNRAELIGRLGRDPDIRYTTEGKAIANFALATQEIHRDPNSGDKQRHTEWHRIVLFGRQAEIAEQYLKKGSLAHIEGSIKTRRWKNKDGIDVTLTEILAGTLTLLDRPPKTQSIEPPKDLEEDTASAMDAFTDPPY